MENNVNTNTTLTQDEKTWAAMSYLWILCLVPLLLRRQSSYVNFHAKQGFGLFVVELIVSVVSIIPVLGWLIAFIGWFVFVILSVMGLVSALSGKRWRLPMVADYVDKWNF
ncbi:MAG: DUF4870 domain-containing protein [Patescibacteria group bacterium]